MISLRDIRLQKKKHQATVWKSFFFFFDGMIKCCFSEEETRCSREWISVKVVF